MSKRDFVSLDILGDAASCLSANFNSDNETWFSDRSKGILKKIIEDELTDNQKYIIKKYYYENKTITEIAQMKGVNKSSVSRSMKVAREKIARSLKYGTMRLWELS